MRTALLGVVTSNTITLCNPTATWTDNSGSQRLQFKAAYVVTLVYHVRRYGDAKQGSGTEKLTELMNAARSKLTGWVCPGSESSYVRPLRMTTNETDNDTMLIGVETFAVTINWSPTQ